jgi:hypothetical protein
MNKVKPWLNGKPYYCKTCNLGGAEVMACEDGCCDMESVEDAIARQKFVSEAPTPAELAEEKVNECPLCGLTRDHAHGM